MPATADFITLAYSEDLTLAGIKHACQQLREPTWMEKDVSLSQLRQHVAEKATELAFLRHLQSQDIPHQIVLQSSFTEPDRHDLNLGGRRCLIKTHLLRLESAEQKGQYTLERLYHSNVLMPATSLTVEGINNSDLVVFTFVFALKSTTSRNTRRGQGCYIYRMPASWSSPKRAAHLGQIAIRNDSTRLISLEISGIAAGKQLQSEVNHIQPGSRSAVDTDLSSLNFLQCEHRPAGRIYLYHPATNRTHYIYPRQWLDIWVHGIEIIIIGYTTVAELRKSMPTSTESVGSSRTFPKKAQYLSYPIADLHSMKNLFKQVQAWQKR